MAYKVASPLKLSHCQEQGDFFSPAECVDQAKKTGDGTNHKIMGLNPRYKADMLVKSTKLIQIVSRFCHKTASYKQPAKPARSMKISLSLWQPELRKIPPSTHSTQVEARTRRYTGELCCSTSCSLSFKRSVASHGHRCSSSSLCCAPHMASLQCGRQKRTCSHWQWCVWQYAVILLMAIKTDKVVPSQLCLLVYKP